MIFRKLFSDKNGNLLKTGDIVKFQKLADTLETIAEEGAGAFYHGTIAKDLIRDIQEAGISTGINTLIDQQSAVDPSWAQDFVSFQEER